MRNRRRGGILPSLDTDHLIKQSLLFQNKKKSNLRKSLLLSISKMKKSLSIKIEHQPISMKEYRQRLRILEIKQSLLIDG